MFPITRNFLKMSFLWFAWNVSKYFQKSKDVAVLCTKWSVTILRNFWAGCWCEQPRDRKNLAVLRLLETNTNFMIDKKFMINYCSFWKNYRCFGVMVITKAWTHILRRNRSSLWHVRGLIWWELLTVVRFRYPKYDLVH